MCFIIACTLYVVLSYFLAFSSGFKYVCISILLFIGCNTITWDKSIAYKWNFWFQTQKRIITQPTILCLHNTYPDSYFFANTRWMEASNSFKLASCYAWVLLLASITFNIPFPLLYNPFYFYNLALQVAFLWLVLLHPKQTLVNLAAPRFIGPGITVLICISRIIPYCRGPRCWYGNCACYMDNCTCQL